MRPKLHAIHLPRDAYVDSRQSTGHQGRAHPESPRRHSALAEHARGLGVPHVRVLAEAVGRSGTGRHARPGWGPRLAAVCAGRVSAVFACEASRWARTNRAWHHLIALGALTETWRIDDDGSAAPRQLHERGVRGLQGAMAAYARGCMRQRARQAFAANMPRGHGLGNGPQGPADLEAQGGTHVDNHNPSKTASILGYVHRKPPDLHRALHLALPLGKATATAGCAQPSRASLGRSRAAPQLGNASTRRAAPVNAPIATPRK